MAKLKSDHRIVIHNLMRIDTILRTKDKNKTCSADVPDIKYLFTCLKNSIGFMKDYDKGKVVLKLTDIVISDIHNYCCIMINVRDKTAGTSVIVEDNTDEHQDIALTPGKSWGVSMHVMFSLTQNFGTYKVVYEQVPDVNHRRLVSFINLIFFDVVKKNEANFTRNTRSNEIDPSTQQAIKEKYKLSITIDPQPYDGFSKSVDSGRISDIQVVKVVENSNGNNVDGHNEIIERAHIIKIQTPKLTHGKLDYLKSISEKYASHYERLKFNFTNEDDISGTIEMNTQNLQIENLIKAFSKKSKLTGFSSDLKDSYNQAYTPIIDKIVEVM
ncbi:hypothetical protein [Aeromonas veronii]|uniref:hypothetical protein n=1 Tax=Aeromonas veronii TaxID=654 RepID=UPI001115C76A|nr:hypothetical protein [Aeromonas veronii]